MTITEFETDDIFAELNKKFANVSLEQPSLDDNCTEVMLDDLFECRNILKFSNNSKNCHYAMKNIRRYLTQEITTDRIQTVLDLDIVENMVQYLNSSTQVDQLRYETAWAVTNLAFGTKDQTTYLILNGVVQALIHCFRTTSNYRIKSQTAWGLANISIDSATYREDMAKLNVIGDIASALSQKCQIVYQQMFQNSDLDQNKIVFQSKRDCDDVKDLCWSLANLCRGGYKTAEYWEQSLFAFDALSQCAFFETTSIWPEACWGLSRILSNMFDNEIFYHHLILNSKLYTRLVSLMKDQPPTAVLPVLQTISNFTSAPNNYIEELLAADLLSNLYQYTLPEMPPQLRRNAFLTIANLAAGGEEAVAKVIYNEDIMESVVASIKIPGHEYDKNTYSWCESTKMTRSRTNEEWKILRELLWIISNIFALALDDCVCFTLRKYTNIVHALSSLLRFHRLPLSICLKLVDVYLSFMERTNQIVNLASSVQSMERNPYAEELVKEGTLRYFNEHCIQHGSDELRSQLEDLYTVVMSSVANVTGSASAFGLSQSIHLPGPNVRRIVHGFEDGDIRSIESAFTNIQL